MKVAKLYSPQGGFVKQWPVQGYDDINGPIPGILIQSPSGDTVELIPLGMFVVVIQEIEEPEK